MDKAPFQVGRGFDFEFLFITNPGILMEKRVPIPSVVWNRAGPLSLGQKI
jgi:hypothetical protein